MLTFFYCLLLERYLLFLFDHSWLIFCSSIETVVIVVLLVGWPEGRKEGIMGNEDRSWEPADKKTEIAGTGRLLFLEIHISGSCMVLLPFREIPAAKRKKNLKKV